MKKERRSCTRIPLKIRGKIYCGDSQYTVTLIDCSENGVCISMRSNCLPCGYITELFLPVEKGILRLKAQISRIRKLNNDYFIIGMSLLTPHEHYRNLIGNMRERYESLTAGRPSAIVIHDTPHEYVNQSL